MKTLIDVLLIFLPVLAAVFGGFVFRRIDEWWQMFLDKMQ